MKSCILISYNGYRKKTWNAFVKLAWVYEITYLNFFRSLLKKTKRVHARRNGLSNNEPKLTRQLFWLISERRLREITVGEKWEIYRVIDKDGYSVSLHFIPSLQPAFYIPNLHEIYTQCWICSLYFIGTDADPQSTLLNIWSKLLFNISSLLIINLRANPKHGSILFTVCLNSAFVLQFW